MSDEQSADRGAWREVGDQFRTLGDRLAAALRATWESEETRQSLHEMQSGLESMVNTVGQAINEASATPTGQRVREEARKAAATARTAGQEAWQEAQPHLLAALLKANAELEKLVSRMEERQAGAAEPPADDSGDA